MHSRGKKGNITLFFIIGLLFVIIISFALLGISQKRERILESEQEIVNSFSATKSGILDYMDNCIDYAYASALSEIGISEDTKAAFEYALAGNLETCSDNLKSSFEELGFSVAQEDAKAEAQITSDTAIIKIIYPQEFRKDETILNYGEQTKVYSLSSFVNIPKGVADTDIILSSPDGKVVLSIPKGTKLKDKDGKPVLQPSIKIVDRNFDSLSNNNVVGETVYEILPDGMSFSKPAELKMKFRPNEFISHDSAMNSMIGWLYEGPNVWVMRGDTKVLRENENYFASVDITHATSFSLQASKPGEPGCGKDSAGDIIKTGIEEVIFHKYKETSADNYELYGIKEFTDAKCVVGKNEISKHAGSKITCSGNGTILKSDIVNLADTYNGVIRNENCEEPFISIPYTFEVESKEGICCCDNFGGEPDCIVVEKEKGIEPVCTSPMFPEQRDPNEPYLVETGKCAALRKDPETQNSKSTQQIIVPGYTDYSCAGGSVKDEPIFKAEITKSGDACIKVDSIEEDNIVLRVSQGIEEFTESITKDNIGSDIKCSSGDKCNSVVQFAPDQVIGGGLKLWLMELSVENSQDESGSIDFKAAVEDFHFTLSLNGQDSDRYCFVAGTKILTPDGEKNIEDVKQDDLVWSYNHEKSQKELQPVLKAFIREAPELIELILDDGTVIEGTPDHPFYDGKKYRSIKEFAAGDYVFLLKENLVPVKIKEIKFEKKMSEVYNLLVSKNNNYFAQGILVHNQNDYSVLKTVKGYNNLCPAIVSESGFGYAPLLTGERSNVIAREGSCCEGFVCDSGGWVDVTTIAKPDIISTITKCVHNEKCDTKDIEPKINPLCPVNKNNYPIEGESPVASYAQEGSCCFGFTCSSGMADKLEEKGLPLICLDGICFDWVNTECNGRCVSGAKEDNTKISPDKPFYFLENACPSGSNEGIKPAPEKIGGIDIYAMPGACCKEPDPSPTKWLCDPTSVDEYSGWIRSECDENLCNKQNECFIGKSSTNILSKLDTATGLYALGLSGACCKDNTGQQAFLCQETNSGYEWTQSSCTENCFENPQITSVNVKCFVASDTSETLDISEAAGRIYSEVEHETCMYEDGQYKRCSNGLWITQDYKAGCRYYGWEQNKGCDSTFKVYNKHKDIFVGEDNEYEFIQYSGFDCAYPYTYSSQDDESDFPPGYCLTDRTLKDKFICKNGIWEKASDAQCSDVDLLKTPCGCFLDSEYKPIDLSNSGYAETTDKIYSVGKNTCATDGNAMYVCFVPDNSGSVPDWDELKEGLACDKIIDSSGNFKTIENNCYINENNLALVGYPDKMYISSDIISAIYNSPNKASIGQCAYDMSNFNEVYECSSSYQWTKGCSTNVPLEPAYLDFKDDTLWEYGINSECINKVYENYPTDVHILGLKNVNYQGEDRKYLIYKERSFLRIVPIWTSNGKNWNFDDDKINNDVECSSDAPSNPFDKLNEPPKPPEVIPGAIEGLAGGICTTEEIYTILDTQIGIAYDERENGNNPKAYSCAEFVNTAFNLIYKSKFDNTLNDFSFTVTHPTKGIQYQIGRSGNGRNMCDPNFGEFEFITKFGLSSNELLPGDIFSSQVGDYGHAGMYVGMGTLENPHENYPNMFKTFIPGGGQMVFIHADMPGVYYSYLSHIQKYNPVFCRPWICHKDPNSI